MTDIEKFKQTLQEIGCEYLLWSTIVGELHGDNDPVDVIWIDDASLRFNQKDGSFYDVESWGDKDECVKRIAELEELLVKAHRKLSSQKHWNGQGWTYHPIAPPHYEPLLSEIQTALENRKNNNDTAK